MLCENLDAPVLAPACGDQVYEESSLDGKHEVEHGESLPQRGAQVPHVRLRHVAAEVCLDAAVPVETLDDADGVPIDSWVGRELLLCRTKVVGGPILLFLAGQVIKVIDRQHAAGDGAQQSSHLVDRRHIEGLHVHEAPVHEDHLAVHEGARLVAGLVWPKHPAHGRGRPARHRRKAHARGKQCAHALEGVVAGGSAGGEEGVVEVGCDEPDHGRLPLPSVRMGGSNRHTV